MIKSDCFDSVSIFLSEIADFHKLVASSKPKQVGVNIRLG